MVIRLKKLLTATLGVLLIVLGLIFLCYSLFGMDADENLPRTKGDTQTAVNAPVRQIDPSKPMLALTFDDGPYGPVTLRILDALEAVGGRATFFIVGSRIDGREETVRRIAASGCELGNHTYDHVSLKGLSAAQIQEQLTKTDEKIFEVTNQHTTVLRPPGGAYDDTLYTVLQTPAVLWTVDTMDWSHQNKDITVQRVLEHAEDGDIILMHDLFTPTADAAEALIPALCERGFQLVTVSELLAYRDNPDGVLQINS